MRWIVVVLAVALAACDASVTSDDKGAAGSAGGYTMEIRATSAEQTYLITAPDGRVVGARAADGASALMDNSRALALAHETPPQAENDGREVVSLRVPGFNLRVAGDEDDKNGDNGRVQLSVGGDHQNVEVNADEGGPGDADDRAHVRITGADEAAVRQFIADADKLSPAVQAQLLTELHLD